MNGHNRMLRRFINGSKVATVFFLCLVITLVYSTSTLNVSAMDNSDTSCITYCANGGNGGDFVTEKYQIGSSQNC